MRQTIPKYESFPMKSYDKLRYGDMDSQGHVNNAVFSTFLETGRTELLLDVWRDEIPMFGLVSSSIKLMGEVHWPGTVEIGTGIKKIGNSSITFTHGLYQNGTMVAQADTVTVQMDELTRKSKALSEEIKEAIKKYVI